MDPASAVIVLGPVELRLGDPSRRAQRHHCVDGESRPRDLPGWLVRSGRRRGGPGVIVDVRLAPVLLAHVPMRNVDVIERRVVVIVCVSREQVSPVLSLGEVVGDVEMLVVMNDGVVLVMLRLDSHRRTSSEPYPPALPSPHATNHRAMCLDGEEHLDSPAFLIAL